MEEVSEQERPAAARPTVRIVVAPPSPASAPDTSRLRVSRAVLTQFTRSLAIMYDTGINLVRALAILASQSDVPGWAAVLRSMVGKLEQGGQLSDSLVDFPHIFSPLYVALVRVGEQHGAVGRSLNQAADFIERDEWIVRRLKQAFTQPLIVFCLSLGAALLLCDFLVPHFVEALSAMHATLPTITIVLVTVVTFMQKPWVLACAALLAGLAVHLGRAMLRSKQWRLAWHRWLLDLPLLGDLLLKCALVRMLRAMASLLLAGVHLVTTIKLSADATANEWMIAEMHKKIAWIENGQPLYRCFRDIEGLEPVVWQMVRVGEESGQLDMLLEKLARYIEEDVNRALDNIGSVLEPVLMIFTGLIVGVVILAIFLPFYSMISQL